MSRRWFVTTQSNSSVDVALSSAETSCRRVPDHVSVSRIAYFKRKFVDVEDEAPLSFRTYCQSVSDHTLTTYANVCVSFPSVEVLRAPVLNKQTNKKIKSDIQSTHLSKTTFNSLVNSYWTS